MCAYKLKTPPAVEKTVVNAYHHIEDGVVGAYKSIERGVVGVYKRIENKFVDAFLEALELVERPAQDAE